MKPAVETFTARNPNLIKLLAVIVGTLSLELFVLLAVLKQDAQTDVAAYRWSVIVFPTLFTCFFALCIWTWVHYHLAGNDLGGRWSWEWVRLQLIEIINVDHLEQYHERYLFRDLMLTFAYVTMIAYGALIQNTKCRNCDTPFGMAAIGVMVINCVRLVLLLMRAYFDFFRLREMCSEIRFFKSWRDEKRFKEDVVPSLAMRSQWNYYKIFEGCSFIALLGFILLGTMWVESGACADTCPRAYNLTMYLVIGVFVFEGVYVLSVVALTFFHRSLGVEGVEKVVKWVTEDNQKKADAKMEKAKIAKEEQFGADKA